MHLLGYLGLELWKGGRRMNASLWTSVFVVGESMCKLVSLPFLILTVLSCDVVAAASFYVSKDRMTSSLKRSV